MNLSKIPEGWLASHRCERRFEFIGITHLDEARPSPNLGAASSASFRATAFTGLPRWVKIITDFSEGIASLSSSNLFR